MPDARLAEVRAAYGISTTATRSEVAAHLLAGRSAWSQELLDAHRVAAGGRWRDVHAPAQGSRKRKAVAKGSKGVKGVRGVKGVDGLSEGSRGSRGSRGSEGSKGVKARSEELVGSME